MRKRLGLLVLASAIGLAVVIVWWSSPSETEGAQRSGPVVELASADTQAWSILTPSDGGQRLGWPRPMLARGDRICFGFENPVFVEEVRPSLARCVDRTAIPVLEPNAIVVLFSIEAGLDVWQIVMFAAPLIRLDLLLEAGGGVTADRVHVDGDIAAIRLARNEPLSEISWLAGRSEARCEPDVDAVETGAFCATAPAVP